MTVEALAVIIPARDEQESICACLESVIASANVVLPLPTLIVVVDDASTDATAALAERALRGRPHLIIRQERSNVGSARADGVRQALASLRPLDAEAVWLAFTDADTVVPADWLSLQLAWAESGAAAVAGIVRLPAAERAANARYEAFYAAGIWPTGHRHVHGANMGVAATAYMAVGGFADLRLGEDNDLWQRLETSNLALVSDPSLVVQTSARHASRVMGGHASVLARFDPEAGP